MAMCAVFSHTVKKLAAAVGRLLKATSQATEGWADVAADMGSVRNEKSCR